MHVDIWARELERFKTCNFRCLHLSKLRINLQEFTDLVQKLVNYSENIPIGF